MGYGNAFLGMRGTGDWATDERPKNWRETILYLYPNGMTPLTAILSKMASESTNDPQFHWWTKMLQHQGGDVASVYKDPDLATEDTGTTTSRPTAGAIRYAKVKEAVAMHMRPGHQVMLREDGDYSVDCVGKVISVVKNGDTSSIGIKLLQDVGAAKANDYDLILVIGSINPEGGPMPTAIAYNPVKWYNYTQIFRTPLSITRTARRTKLRTAEAYKEAKREALEYHGIEMEKAFLFGLPTEGTGDNGKPERTTCGLINAIRGTGITGHGGTGGSLEDFHTDTTSGDAWVDEGEEWIDEKLEKIFRYGGREKLAFAGSGALLGLNKLVKNKGTFEFKSSTKSYGIQVVEWTTAFGSINLMTHPLFSYDPVNRHSLVIFEPKDIKFRYIDDTTFYGEGDQQNTGRNRVDGTDEEYLTEAGLEYHHPVGWGYFNNVGVDNP